MYSKEIKPILEEINPEHSLEGLMMKPQLQCFGHPTRTADSLGKSLMLGKTEGRRGHQKRRRPDGTADAMDMNSGKLRETVRDREAWSATVHGVTERQTWLGDQQQSRN